MSTMDHGGVRYIRTGESKLVHWEGVLSQEELRRLLDLPMNGEARIVAVGDSGAVEFRHLTIKWKEEAGA